MTKAQVCTVPAAFFCTNLEMLKKTSTNRGNQQKIKHFYPMKTKKTPKL
jgi:hypothetical protein